MAYGGRSASYAGLKPETTPRQHSLMELAVMSHAPVERYSAQEYRSAAAEYRARMGRDFSRDSIYNGLWTRAAAQDGAVGKGWGQDVVNDMAGVATEAGVHAQTGMATGAAAAGMAARRGNHSGIIGSIFGANGGAEVVNESLASLNSPVTRHYADKVTQTTVAKEVNTVIDRSVVDISADVSAIRSGQSQMIGDTFVVNGRTYGIHDGTLPNVGAGAIYLGSGRLQGVRGVE